MAIFKKSLPKEIFGQFIVAIFDKPDITWDALLALATTYAAVPLTRDMLMQKSSLHSMKPSNLNPSAGIFGVEVSFSQKMISNSMCPALFSGK